MTDEITALMGYHGKTLSLEQLKDYVWFFDNHERNADEIVARWKFKKAPTDRFPSVAELSTIATDIKNEEWQRLKAKEPTFETWQRSAKTPHAKKAIQMMVDLYSGKMMRGEYLKQMRQMDIEFPGLGWAQQAYELEKFWKE